MLQSGKGCNAVLQSITGCCRVSQSTILKNITEYFQRIYFDQFLALLLLRQHTMLICGNSFFLVLDLLYQKSMNNKRLILKMYFVALQLHQFSSSCKIPPRLLRLAGEFCSSAPSQYLCKCLYSSLNKCVIIMRHVLFTVSNFVRLESVRLDWCHPGA